MHPVLFAQEEAAGFIVRMFNVVFTFIATQGVALLVNIAAAAAIFFVGRWACQMILSLLRRFMQRSKVDETLAKFLENIAYGLIMALVVMAAVSRLGVDTTSFAAMIAACGLAVGLALQSSLGNFAAGVMLILFKPFKVGDFVDAGGTAGVVEEIHIFSTFMRTGDNVLIIIPNGQITAGVIKNFSAKDTRRIDLVVGCGYDDDLLAVKSFLVSLIEADERILKDPEPVVAVNELADSSVNFVMRPWVAAADYWAVRWELTEKIKLGFDERGFNIPFPQQDVHMYQASESA